MEYKRDGRSPIPEDNKTSRVMSANRGKNTGPELILRKALRDAGLLGYRLHYEGAPGRPDVSYPGKRVAIFVHGCFWHRCPKCRMPIPRSHSEFWKSKFEANKRRDRAKTRALISDGWNVLTIWECEIERDIVSCISRVRQSLGVGRE